MLSELTYMHDNPVRAWLVATPGEYEYSSYQAYFGNAYKNLIDRQMVGSGSRDLSLGYRCG